MIPVVERVTSCDECPFSILDDYLLEYTCAQGGECTTEGPPPADCPLRASPIVVTLAEGV